MPEEETATPAPDPQWVSLMCEMGEHSECTGMVVIVSYASGRWMDVMHKCLCGCHDKLSEQEAP